MATLVELVVILLGLAVVVQRERVLRRRLRRLAWRFHVHARMGQVYRHVHVLGDEAPVSAPVWQSQPTVQQLAGLARPLSGTGG